MHKIKLQTKYVHGLEPLRGRQNDFLRSFRKNYFLFIYSKSIKQNAHSANWRKDDRGRYKDHENFLLVLKMWKLEKPVLHIHYVPSVIYKYKWVLIALNNIHFKNKNTFVHTLLYVSKHYNKYILEQYYIRLLTLVNI